MQDQTLRVSLRVGVEEKLYEGKIIFDTFFNRLVNIQGGSLKILNKLVFLQKKSKTFKKNVFPSKNL